MTKENTVTEISGFEAIRNIVELRIPRMLSIQALADECGFAYKTLWKLCKQDKIVHIRVGNKYLINFDKFIEYLNIGER